MLPEIGASELMVIAAVALIVVGPKDLPVLLRKVGQFVAKLRGLANDFRSSFDEMARQSELDELRKEVAAMRAGQMTSLDDGGASKVFEDINAGLTDRSLYNPALTQDYHPGETPVETPAVEAPAAEPEAAAKPKRVRKPKVAAVEAAPEVEAAPAKAAKPRAARSKKAQA